MPEPLMEGYKELWGAVLMCAINDALCEFPTSKEALRAKRDATNWLDHPDEHFARVCTFAGLDPVAVYQAWKGKRIKRPGQLIIMPSNRVVKRQANAEPKPGRPWKNNGSQEEVIAKTREILSEGWVTQEEVRKALRVGRARAQAAIQHFGKHLDKRRGAGSRIEYRLTEQRVAAE